MQILYKNRINELILNINNNSRENFSTYLLTFTHSLSQEVKSYTINTSDNSVFGKNNRYCEIILDLRGVNDLNYEGQYQLQIFGNNNTLVYTTLCDLRILNDPEPFIQYQSNNEDGEKYIYIE